MFRSNGWSITHCKGYSMDHLKHLKIISGPFLETYRVLNHFEFCSLCGLSNLQAIKTLFGQDSGYLKPLPLSKKE
jgi:hypothetical protein